MAQLKLSGEHCRVSDSLQKEVRNNAIFQVYESHVPYILQFFIDHSIFGMDLVHLSHVKFRVSPQRSFNGLFFQKFELLLCVSDCHLKILFL